MTMWVSFVSVISILVIALWRARVRKRGRQRAAHRQAPGRFQAVTVKWSWNACTAMTRLEGQRIICAEAPSFPLPDCDVEQCNCRYEFHGDRRDGERRLLDGRETSFIITYGAENRRELDDRRSEAS